MTLHLSPPCIQRLQFNNIFLFIAVNKYMFTRVNKNVSTVVFVLKGGKYLLRYLYRKQLSEKYEIYRRTKKS
jgi:hypothetical protein